LLTGAEWASRKRASRLQSAPALPSGAFLGVWTLCDWRWLSARGTSTRPIVSRAHALVGLKVAFFFPSPACSPGEAHLGGFLAGL
jgi:hypothetical protein